MQDNTEIILSYIRDNHMSKESLEKIKIPSHIALKLSNLEKYDGDWEIYNFFNTIIHDMNNFLWEELYYKDTWKNIEEVKLAVLLKHFDLPICPLWLNLCDLVKTEFNEKVYR